MRKLIRIYKPQVLALAEPFAPDTKMDRLMVSLQFNNCLSNANHEGKIWLFWSQEVHLQLLSMSNQFITVLCSAGIHKVVVTFVYAKCCQIARLKLWRNLEVNIPTNIPWMVTRDFNIILRGEICRGVMGMMAFLVVGLD